MTKEITKARVMQEMQDKLKLREFEHAAFLFDETVVPVYNIEQHFRTWKTGETIISITSATFFEFFEVPENERWYLRAYVVIFGMTGAHKASGVYILRKASPTASIYLDLTKGQEVSYLRTLQNVVPLNPGDKIYILVDSYTSTQDLRLRIDYMVEEIR